MDPILSSQLNAWYSDAVKEANADIAASATEAKVVFEQACIGQPKGANINNLLQRAIAVAKARAEAARAKANAAKAIMENNIAALDGAQTYLAQCEKAVIAAEQKLAADQAEYDRIAASISTLEQDVPIVVVNTVSTEPFAKLETLSTCGGTKLCFDIPSSMALAIEFGNIEASSSAGTS